MNGKTNSRLCTGVQGLDEVLGGGFIRGRAYLVRGGPGCGKTTLGMHFLTTGIKAGESGLYISMGEPEINGELRKAVGVLKKRAGSFEKALRDVDIMRYGIKVGKPLTGLPSMTTSQAFITLGFYTAI